MHVVFLIMNTLAPSPRGLALLDSNCVTEKLQYDKDLP